MNEAFRAHVFGRAFHLHLSDRQLESLAAIVQGDKIAALGFNTHSNGLQRRGLVFWHYEAGETAGRLIPTKAGRLVYELLVEAGEHAAVEAKREETLKLEETLHAREWEERHQQVIRLRDRFRRDPATGEPLVDA